MTVPKTANGADSSMFFIFLTAGLSLSLVTTHSGKGILPFGPNRPGTLSANVWATLFSSPTSLRPTIAASPRPCATTVLVSLWNHGLPALNVFTPPCILPPACIDGSTIESTLRSFWCTGLSSCVALSHFSSNVLYPGTSVPRASLAKSAYARPGTDKPWNTFCNLLTGL